MADQYQYKTGLTPQPSSFDWGGGANIGGQVVAAAASLAAASISYHHSKKMDSINYAREVQQQAAQKELNFMERQRNAHVYSLNREKLKKSLMSSRLAFEIDSMKQMAEYENALSSMNNSNTTYLLRAAEKSQIRARAYGKEDMLNKLSAQRVAAIEQQKQPYMVAPVKGSSATHQAQLGLDVLQVGQQFLTRAKPTGG